MVIYISKLLEELQNELEMKFQDNFTGLVLFGSYAKGTQRDKSDVDIILIFKKLPKSRIKRNELIIDLIISLEDKYKVDINTILSEENKISKTYLILDIVDYAKIIIDKNNKIHRLFKEVKKDYKKGFVKKIPIKDHYMLWASEKITV